MKKTIFLFVFLIVATQSFSQISSKNTTSVWQAKEYSKDISLFRAKYFLFNTVLGINDEVQRFELIPLAATSSGELTTLLYKTDSKEGLILGFYGSYWDDSGVSYQGYSFKNLNKEEAYEFLDKIITAVNDNSMFLSKNTDNNNIYFKYKDIEVLVYYSGFSRNIRLFWNGFDSTWEGVAFDRTVKRFEKKIN